MKIINAKDFLKMPSGTIFCKFEPLIFGNPMVKCSPLMDGDFFYMNLFEPRISSDDIFKAIELSSEISFDDSSIFRDGFFDESQLYAIYSRDDISNVLDRMFGCSMNKIDLITKSYDKEARTDI